MNIRIEEWKGYEIRFIETMPGEWSGVIQDICVALDIKNVSQAAKRLKPSQKGVCKVYTPGGEQEMLCANEFGIYKLILRSNKPERDDFEDWICEVISVLRKATGLEGFQIFRMVDKDHQKEAMSRLCGSLNEPKRVHFMKANSIADKAVSTKYGHPKMLKKGQMTPRMLVDRQPILDDTVTLMALNEKYGLGISVSKTIYSKHTH